MKNFGTITPELLRQAADAYDGLHIEFTCFAVEEAARPGYWLRERRVEGGDYDRSDALTKAHQDYERLLELHGVNTSGAAFEHCKDRPGTRFMWLEFLAYWLEDTESL